MIAMLAGVLTFIVILTLVSLIPAWLGGTILLVGGATIFVLGLCRAAAAGDRHLDNNGDDNVYKFPRGCP